MFDPQEPQGEEAQQQGPMVVPPLRTYRVTRRDPATAEMVEIVVMAHMSSLTQSGYVLQFLELVLDPLAGPRQRVVKMFNGWDSFYEEYTAPSNLIVPRDLGAM